MSTRSTYRVIETGKYEGKNWKNRLVLVYVQCDGYPSGHPVETAQWLASGTVVNGLGLNEDNKLVFNGASCLAAQLVARLKDGAGGTYIYPVGHRGKCGEDYVYDIIIDSETKEIEFVAYENNTRWNSDRVSTKRLFKGKPADFETWVQNND